MACIHSVPAWLGLLTIASAFVLNMIAVGSPNWANNRPLPVQEASDAVYQVDTSLGDAGDVTVAPLTARRKRAVPIGSQEDKDSQTGTDKADSFLPQADDNPAPPLDFNSEPPPDDFLSTNNSNGTSTPGPTVTSLPDNVTRSVRLGVFELCEDDDCRPLAGDELETWFMALQVLVSAALLLDASSCVIGLVLAVCPSCCDPGCCDSLHLWAQYNLVAIVISFLCGVTSQVLFAAEGLQWDFLGYRLHLSWAYNAYFGVVILHVFAAILYFCEVKRIHSERDPYFDIGSFLDVEKLYKKDQKRGYHNIDDDADEFNYGGT